MGLVVVQILYELFGCRTWYAVVVADLVHDSWIVSELRQEPVADEITTESDDGSDGCEGVYGLHLRTHLFDHELFAVWNNL
jgi:hypothetical protein